MNSLSHETPVFSIITPCFNSEKYIEECIKSVLNQNFQDFEFLIIDDGSFDSSSEIIKKYADFDNRIKFFKKENQGQGIQKNFLIKQSKGKYILFLDSDDWLEDNALKKLFNKFQKDDSDVVIFDGFKYEQKSGKKSFFEYTKFFYKIFKEKNFSPTKDAKEFTFKINGLTFKTYKRDFLIKNDIKFSPTRFIEDSEFYFKIMLTVEKLSCLKEKILNYRIHPLSTTFTKFNRTEDIKYAFYICEKIVKNSSFNKDKTIINAFLENRMAQIFYYYKKIKNDPKTKKEYYNLIKEILKYIKRNYGFDFVTTKPKLKKYNDIINFSFEFYYFLKKFKRKLRLTKMFLKKYFEI